MTMNTTGTVNLNTTASPIAARPARAPRRLLRSIAAVFAGLLANFILASAADAVLHAVGLYPPFPQRMADSLFLLAAAYRMVFGVAGAYLTARLAPHRPLVHALVLGGIGVVLSIVGAIAFGKYGPAWYSLAIIAISLPCAWAGARLRQRQLLARVAQQRP
jgi:hypothetical protein